MLTNLAKLRQEMGALSKQCKAQMIGDNPYAWEVALMGPSDTPYAGGTFYLEASFPANYPEVPPTVKFKTKIYHPNIDSNGKICLAILGSGWSNKFNVDRILQSICSLLYDPNADDPLAPDVARLYKTDRNEYEKTVRKWTQEHAKE